MRSTSGITLAGGGATFLVLLNVLAGAPPEATQTVRAMILLSAIFALLLGLAVFEIGRAIRSLKP